MRGADEIRRLVSLSCRKRQIALSNARRGRGIRRSPRQHKRFQARWLHKGIAGQTGGASSLALRNAPVSTREGKRRCLEMKPASYAATEKAMLSERRVEGVPTDWWRSIFARLQIC